MSWCSDAPEDEAISLFAGLLANPDMTLSPCSNKRVVAAMRSLATHVITFVGLDETISIGLELAVVANDASQHLNGNRLSSLVEQRPWRRK
jgi:hypothetical protein